MFKSWLKHSLLLSSFYRVHFRARAPVYENQKESWWTFRRRHVWYLVEATTSIKTDIIFWFCHFVHDLVHSRACSHVDWKMTTVKNNIQWVCHVHKRMSQNEAPILFQGCNLTQPWWGKDYSKRNLLESKVESWLGKKLSFGQLYVSRQNASASIESIAYFKEIGQWFWALSQNQTSNFYLNTVWSLLPEPNFLGNYFLGSPLSKDIWCKERSVLQCCNPFVKCHATSFLKDNWDILPWRNAKAKNHVWKPRSLVVQEITGGLCLIVSNSFFDLHAPWNRAESKWTYAIPTMISWMRNCPEWFS